MSTVIHLPEPQRLRAGMDAVRNRAHHLHANSDDLRTALATLLREMQAGRSTAAAVAIATGTFHRRQSARVHGGEQ